MLKLAKIICGLASLCVVTLPSVAQDYVYAAGNPSYSTQIPVEGGFIDLDNGNLHFELSLSSHPQRGKLALNERLVYDSRIWKIVSNNGQSWQPTNIPNSMGGWRFTTGLETGTVSYTSNEQDGTEVVSCQVDHRQEQDITESWTANTQFVWTDSQGTSHMFPIETLEPILVCSNDRAHDVATGQGYAVDGSGYYATVSGYENLTVYDSSGNEVYPVVQDTNGNFFSQDANGNLVDTAGNTPVLVSSAGNQIYYDVLAWNGSRQRYTVTTQTIPFATQFGQYQVAESSGSFTVISQITLPDGSAYSFGYDSGSYGELTSITLPTGGTIGYGYVSYVDSYNNINRWISSRTKDGATTAINRAVLSQCLQVAGTGNCQQQATVVTPAGDTKIYSFYLDGTAYANSFSQIQSVEVYNGAVSSGATPAIYQSTTSQFSATTSSDGLTSYILPTIVTTNTFFDGANVGTQEQTTLANGYLPTSVATWDFFQNPAPAPTKIVNYTYGTTVNGALLLTGTQVTDGSGTQVAQSTIGYDATTATATTGLPNHNTVLGNSRGNPTSISQWVNTSNSWITSTSTYDDAGVVLSTTDPNLNPATTYGHDAADLCVTTTTRPTTNSVPHVSHSTCDSSTGLLASTTDENGQVTTYNAYDGFDRLLQVSYPDGGQSVWSFPSPTQVVTKTLQQTNVWLTVTTNLDSYGRQSHVIRADPQGDDSVDYTYDGNGRSYCVSNPHRIVPSSTDGTRCVTYDALDRPITVTEPDGQTRQAQYSGNATTLTDETGRVKKQINNAFGQLTSVFEADANNTPSIETDYQYNLLGNLTSVNQRGVAGETSRGRTFVYDSASRLISQTNPENGPAYFNYDNNGNLLNATDARGVTVTYAYDALNRVTNESSPGGVGVPGLNNTHGYDSPQPNGIGRLWYINGSEAQSYFYDAMGRIITQKTYLPSTPRTESDTFAVYDLDGELTSLTYPDGRVVKQYWIGGQLQTVTFDNWNGQSVGYPYLSSATYWPNGSPQSMTFGNGTVQTSMLNSRFQPTEISLQGGAGVSNQLFLDKQYCYGPSNLHCPTLGSGRDNGNIWLIKDAMDVLNSRHSQGFSYDNLNRLTAFASGDGSMQQAYTIDSFGNMSQSGTASSSLSFGASNQINSSGYGYDSTGNLTSFNNGVFTATYAYDADNRLVNLNNGGATYTYDADGQRVRKDVGNAWTEYVYFGGRPLAERNRDGTWSDYVYANGQRIARADGYDVRIHVHGTTPGGATTSWQIGGGGGYVIKANDKLLLRQIQFNGNGGPNVQFTDGTQTYGVALDSSGQAISADQIQTQWLNRTIDLSAYAGKTVSDYQVVTDRTTPAGNYDLFYGDIAIVSSDGSVTPVYTRQQGAAFPNVYNEGQTNLSAIEEVSNQAGDSVQPLETTTYYHGDQIDSARMLTSAGGWPLSSDTFYPFGQEQTATIDPNHYKFTGLERDQESGLDHALFRQYSSTAGRWMSPDPSGLSFADPSNPQSLNLYSYVLNRPLVMQDRSGLCGYTSTGIDVSTNIDGSQQIFKDSTYVDTGYCYFEGFSGGSGVDGEGGGGEGETAPSNKNCQAGPLNLTQTNQTARQLAHTFWYGSPWAAVNAASTYIKLVQTGGAWDPKNWPGIPGSSLYGQYTAAGNINFGSTCIQFGSGAWGSSICQYGAGAYGHYFGTRPTKDIPYSDHHGDQPADNEQIQQGIAKAKC